MIDELLAWGASLHYPRIVLDRETRQCLRAGEQAWRTLLASDEREMIARLAARRERWSEISEKEN